MVVVVVVDCRKLTKDVGSAPHRRGNNPWRRAQANVKVEAPEEASEEEEEAEEEDARKTDGWRENSRLSEVSARDNWTKMGRMGIAAKDVGSRMFAGTALRTGRRIHAADPD